MSTKTTRRAFVGGGLAVAAGVGAAKLPDFVGRTNRRLALDFDELTASGPSPAFGTLKPGSSGSQPSLSGRLRERGSSRPAGRITITAIPGADGILHVQTLDLHDGTIVAIGPDTASVFEIASGTRAYAGTRGRVTVRGAKTAAPSLDVDLEL